MSRLGVVADTREEGADLSAAPTAPGVILERAFIWIGCRFKNCRSLGFAPNEQNDFSISIRYWEGETADSSASLLMNKHGSGCSAGLDTQSRRDYLKVAQDVSPGLELEEKGSPGGTAESIPLQSSLRDWPNC